MSKFTIEDLATILRDGAGEAEPIDWSATNVLHTPFEGLGYDSIAMLETAGRVGQKFGIEMDEELPILRTPGQFLDHVNNLIGAVD